MKLMLFYWDVFNGKMFVKIGSSVFGRFDVKYFNCGVNDRYFRLLVSYCFFDGLYWLC